MVTVFLVQRAASTVVLSLGMTMEVLGTKRIQKDMERSLSKDKEKKVPEDTETTHWRLLASL